MLALIRGIGHRGRAFGLFPDRALIGRLRQGRAAEFHGFWRGHNVGHGGFEAHGDADVAGIEGARFLDLHARHEHRQRRLLRRESCGEHRLGGGAIALIVVNAAHRGIVGQPRLEGVIFGLAFARTVEALEHLQEIGIGPAQLGAEAGLEGVEMLDGMAGQRGDHQLLLDGAGLDGGDFIVSGALRGSLNLTNPQHPCKRAGARFERPSHSTAHYICYAR